MACVVNLCRNRSDKGRPEGVRLLRFPRDKKQRRLWLNAAQRPELLENGRYKGRRICNQHFVTGNPSRNCRHPDYVPSIFPWLSEEQRLPLLKKGAEWAATHPNYPRQHWKRSRGRKQQSQKAGEQSQQQVQSSAPLPPEHEQKQQPTDLLIGLPGLKGPSSGEPNKQIDPQEHLQSQQSGELQDNKLQRRLVVLLQKLPEGYTGQVVRRDDDNHEGKEDATANHHGDHTYSKDPQSAPVEPEPEETETSKFDKTEQNPSLESVAVQDPQIKPKNVHKFKKNVDPLQCPICGHYSWCVLRFAAHVQTHADQLLTCKVCDKTFPQKSDLDAHRRAHSSEELFSCPHCEECFGFKKCLHNHIKQNHASEESFRCPHCDEYFSSKKSVQEHVERTHVTKKSFSCPHCDKFFSSKKSMREHVEQTHSPEKSFSCPHCDKRYRAKSSLRHHMKQHMSSSNCTYCGQKFLDKKALELHLLRHKWRTAREAAVSNPENHSGESTMSNASSSSNIPPSTPTAPKKRKLQKTPRTDSGNHSSSSSNPLPKKRKLQQTPSTNPQRAQGNHPADPTVSNASSSSTPQLSTPSEPENRTLQQTTSTFSQQNPGPMLLSQDQVSVPGGLAPPLIFIPVVQLSAGSVALSAVKVASSTFQIQQSDPGGGPLILCPVSNNPPTQQKDPPRPNPRSFECPSCEKSFKRKNSLNGHVCLQRGDIPLQCPHCSKRFASRTSISLHIKTFHTKGKRFSCSGCDKVFRDRRVLNEHMEAKHMEKTVKCPDCDKMFASVQRMEIHSRLHTAFGIKQKRARHKPYSCSVCLQTFETSETAEEHLEIHKKEREAKESSGQSVEQCDISVKYSAGQFLCSECGETFYTNVGLMAHIRSMHTQERPFHCSICDVKFRQKLTFNNHMMIHRGEKPYSCSVCGKRFRQTVSLNAHMLWHKGENPFVCSICGKSFRLKSGLKSHTEIHVTGQPFSCKVCPKKFKRLKFLKHHMRDKHKAGDYHCTYCRKTFICESSLKRHMASHIRPKNQRNKTQESERETERAADHVGKINLE